MKFWIAKKEIKCHGCKGSILRGEHYTKLFICNDNFKKILFFHVECYKEWVISKYEAQYQEWFESLVPKIPRGRPKKYYNGKEVHRKKALIRYHRNKGHEEIVQGLEEELRRLR